MAFSYRAIQSAINGGGFSVNEQHALVDMRPVVLQNVLRGTFTSTSSTTATPVGVGTQASIAAGSQLYLELNSDESVASQGMWLVSGELYMTGVLVGIGMKANLLAADGLTFLNTGNSQFHLEYKNTAAATVQVEGFTSTTQTTLTGLTAVVATVNFRGCIQVAGAGGLYVQVAQNVSTGTAITVGAGSWIRAEAVGQMEH